MTCKHCCDADLFFDSKVAKKDLKKYRKKGAKGATKKLIDVLSRFNREGKSLLDIGGGIGALQWDHLEKGGQTTSDVDASGGYLLVAEEYSNEKGWLGRTNFIKGDFVESEIKPGAHDLLTLDKVVCCYPDYQKLLSKCMENCNEVLALSYPMDSIIAKFLSLFGRAWLKIKGSSFRPYIHSRKEIEATILAGGFSIVENTRSFPWTVQVYQRN